MAPTPQKTVLIRDAEAQWYADRLAGPCPGYRFVSASDNDTALAHASEAEIIMGLAPVLPEALIAAASKLEWVLALTTGVDNLLAMPALDPAVLVTNCNGFHGPQMSELAFLQMLSLNRDFAQMMRNQETQKWERWPQRLLYQKTVTIVGVGAIAEDLAVRCNAFGMTVQGVSDGRSDVPGFSKIFKRVALLEAARAADFLVVLTPYGPSTHHIINAAVFDGMKNDAFLINVSRGGCVDEPALIAALREGKIAGAGLDVFAHEPLPADDPIWRAPNVLITPHIGGMSDIYRQQALPLVQDNLAAYAAKGPNGLRGLVQTR